MCLVRPGTWAVSGDQTEAFWISPANLPMS
jgi:hypothetical protein